MKNLLDRFCRYVQVETTAVDDTDEYPSSPGQLDLGRMLVDELKALKLENVSMSERGIVLSTIPATKPGGPRIAWLAHMDTSHGSAQSTLAYREPSFTVRYPPLRP